MDIPVFVGGVMKRHVAKYFLLSAAVVLAGAQMAAAADPIMEELQKQWEATRSKIVRIAEEVPETKYDYKATPEVRSFREILVHLARENHLYMGYAAGTGRPDVSRFNNLRSRTEILKALSESYDYGAKILADMNDQKLLETVSFFRGQQVPRLTAVLANMKDNHEHYGQLVVYLRVNGIVPPRTAARQR